MEIDLQAIGKSFKALKNSDSGIKEIKIKVILYILSRMILIFLILIFIEEFSRAKNCRKSSNTPNR